MSNDGGADILVCLDTTFGMRGASAIRRILSAALVPFILSAIAAVVCYLSAGPTLGLFLGSLIMVSILTPPLVLAEEQSTNRLIVLCAIVVPFTLIWLLAPMRSETHKSEWLESSIVLIAYATALAGLSVGLRLARLSATVSAALTVTLALLWMTWPIWLSPTWKGEESTAGVARLVVFHPAFAINSMLVRPHGLWTEQSIAYRLTDLSQNVPYTLPRSIWPCVLVHGLIGALLLGLVAWTQCKPREPVVSAPPASS
jgi:hypothetical protein